jgi:hypothetical protein
VHLDDGRVQGDSLDAHVHQALALQLLKQRIEYAGFGPAAHAHVYGVPGAVHLEHWGLTDVHKSMITTSLETLSLWPCFKFSSDEINMPTPTNPSVLAAAQHVRERFAPQIESAIVTGKSQPPRLFAMDTLVGDGVHIQAVAGPIAFEDEVNDPDDPPEMTFFVDIFPDANWEHECAYLVVHRSGRVSQIDELSPPSSRTNTILEEVDYMRLK